MTDRCEFRVNVRIGRGLRPRARNGALVVVDGTLTLYDTEEKVIARAPVGEVWAHRARLPVKGLQIIIDGSRYTLDDAPPPLAKLSPALMLSYIKRTDHLSEQFLDWFGAHGGNVGEPS
ncbi:MAG: hypothetical protein ABIS21_00365 [Acidimicrobiales bacterium]